MDIKKENSTRTGSPNTNNANAPENKTPQRNGGHDEMRQGKLDEEKELKEEASLPDDPDPVLDEQDLEENQLSTEEADAIEWEPEAKKDGKSGL
jgi:hypothetical protein